MPLITVYRFVCGHCGASEELGAVPTAGEAPAPRPSAAAATLHSDDANEVRSAGAGRVCRTCNSPMERKLVDKGDARHTRVEMDWVCPQCPKVAE